MFFTHAISLKIMTFSFGIFVSVKVMVLQYILFCPFQLFSSGLAQNGDDDEGIMGFLPRDIEKEIQRGRKLVCCSSLCMLLKRIGVYSLKYSTSVCTLIIVSVSLFIMRVIM